jgi:hypothetical protein
MNARSLPDRLALAAAVVAAFVAAVGLLAADLYRDAPYWAQQARGTDLATLFAGVPVVLAGLWAVRRGSPFGRSAVVAGLLYLVYNYAIFAFSVAMNPLTGAYIATLGLALWSLVLAGTGLDDRPAAAIDGLSRRLSGALLVAVAVLFGLLWIGQIAAATRTGVPPADLARSGLPTNPVYALDLAFFLPLCAVAGLGLLRRRPAGALALAMLIWVPLMSAGILGGFVFAAAAGDEVPLAVAIVVGAVGLLSGTLAVVPIARYPAGRWTTRRNADDGRAGREAPQEA